MGTCFSHLKPSIDCKRLVLCSSPTSIPQADTEKPATTSLCTASASTIPLSRFKSKSKSTTNINDTIFPTPPPTMPPLAIPTDHPAHRPFPLAVAAATTTSQSNGLPTHPAHRRHIDALKYEMFVERPCVEWKREETRRIGSKRRRSSSWPDAWVGGKG